MLGKLPAILPWPPDRTPSTIAGEKLLSGKTAEIGFYLAARKTSARCICAGIVVPKPLQAWLIEWLHQHWTHPEGAPINLIANVEPDFGQLVVLQAK